MLSRVFRALTALASGAALAACSVFGGQAAPEPSYSVLTSEGAFEIREYPQLVVARTTMAEREGENAAFRRLFRYISGGNDGKREIAMTAPVLVKPGAKIAMTAPVLETGGEVREMAFVLPADLTVKTAPLPTNPEVRIETIPSRRVAVVTYDGRSRPDLETDQKERLESWIAGRELRVTGPAEVAQYNSPWTIPTLRRNEILIPVAE